MQMPQLRLDRRIDMRFGTRDMDVPEPARFVVGFDVETYLIRQGKVIPKLVCASFDWGDDKPPFENAANGVFDRNDAYRWFVRILSRKDVTIVAHNAPFDMAVMAWEAIQRGDFDVLEQIFIWYETGRIRDTRIRQKLIDIANGEHKFYWDDNFVAKSGEVTGKRSKTIHDLQQLVWRHFAVHLPKENTFRLRYDQLDGMPVSEYPKDAYDYSLSDSVWARKVFFSQNDSIELSEEEISGRLVPTIPNEIAQNCAAWAMHLMSAWGLRTRKDRTLKLRDDLKERVGKAWKLLKQWGLVRSDGTKDMDLIRRKIEKGLAAEKLPIPRTRTGLISTDKETLEGITYTDEEFKALVEQTETGLVSHNDWPEAAQLTVLANIGEDDHNLTSFVPTLLLGIDAPINAFFNSLVETGRTSCSKPNLHNPPRKGGVRECFEARPGYFFASCDYDTLELRTLAQACFKFFGYSEMREAILRGEDLHSAFAAEMMGISYADFMARMNEGDSICEEQRQFAKIANFGFPGGLGASGLVAYAKGYGKKIDIKFAKKLHNDWFKKWPEMRAYFNYITSISGRGEGTLIQLFSNRVRGGVRYTQAANSFFQGLAADGAKDALWVVTKECYLDKTSPLYGCRPVIFLHDEIIMEIPYEKNNPAKASAAAKRLQQIMVERMQVWLPDVPAKASPVMMKRWYKGAKPVYDADKNMLPSMPKVEKMPDGSKKTKWVVDEEAMVMAA